MVEKIKYMLNQYFPASIQQIIILINFHRSIRNNIIRLLRSIKYTSQMKKVQAFDSTNMTYDTVKESVFLDCYDILKSSNLIYFGEVAKGCHRFILAEENIEVQLKELLSLGFIIDFGKRGKKTETLANKKISLKKLKKKVANSSLIRIYKIYKTPSGLIEFGSKISFEIERWYLEDDIYITTSKNRIQNKLTKENLKSTISTYIYNVEVAQLKETNLYFQNLKNISVQEIDLVYTWVDGDDEKWKNNKLQFLDEHLDNTKVHTSSVSENRYKSRDELKYSLRSVQKYFSGYRKIFIVTDNQKPKWIKESENLIIVDHKDIFPDKQVLPVFNSHAIEACLHRIKGLSSHYLYLNDDIIFGRSVDVSIFFPQQNKISIFPSNQTFIPFGETSENLAAVDNAAINTRNLLYKNDIGYPVYKFKHTPLPQLKSKLIELEKLFPVEFSTTRKSRFRKHTDISVTSSLLFNYTYLKHIAHRKAIKYNYINLDTLNYEFSLNKSTSTFENMRPDVFCVNEGDGQLQQNEVEKNFIRIMENFLSEKSKFEI